MNRRFVSSFAITALCTTGLSGASAATIDRHHSTPSEQVVVIRNVSFGCTTDRAFINYLAIAPEKPGSHTWTELGSIPGIHVEGLLLGTWYEVPIQKVIDQGLLVKGGYGRWRAYVVQGTGRSAHRVTGPAAGLSGDLCAPFVDEYPT